MRKPATTSVLSGAPWLPAACVRQEVDVANLPAVRSTTCCGCDSVAAAWLPPFRLLLAAAEALKHHVVPMALRHHWHAQRCVNNGGWPCEAAAAILDAGDEALTVLQSEAHSIECARVANALGVFANRRPRAIVQRWSAAIADARLALQHLRTFLHSTEMPRDPPLSGVVLPLEPGDAHELVGRQLHALLELHGDPPTRSAPCVARYARQACPGSRQWFLDGVRRWAVGGRAVNVPVELQPGSGRSLVWVSGAANTGKSVALALVCATCAAQASVCAVFAQDQQSYHRRGRRHAAATARHAVASIAFQLALHEPTVASWLLRHADIVKVRSVVVLHNPSAALTSTTPQEHLRSKGRHVKATETAWLLLVQPLRELVQLYDRGAGRRPRPILVVLDGLERLGRDWEEVQALVWGATMTGTPLPPRHACLIDLPPLVHTIVASRHNLDYAATPQLEASSVHIPLECTPRYIPPPLRPIIGPMPFHKPAFDAPMHHVGRTKTDNTEGTRLAQAVVEWARGGHEADLGHCVHEWAAAIAASAQAQSDQDGPSTISLVHHNVQALRQASGGSFL